MGDLDDAASVARYDALFASLDTSGAGALTRQQVKPVFDRASLPVAVVDSIWSLSAAEDGLLSRETFRNAMHLAKLALQGLPLPHTPAELPHSPASAGGAGLSHEDRTRYDGYFVLLDATGSGRGPGRVSRAQAEPLFDRAGLPADVIDAVWSLADPEGCGALPLAGFRMAMHLPPPSSPTCGGSRTSTATAPSLSTSSPSPCTQPATSGLCPPPRSSPSSAEHGGRSPPRRLPFRALAFVLVITPRVVLSNLGEVGLRTAGAPLLAGTSSRAELRESRCRPCFPPPCAHPSTGELRATPLPPPRASPRDRATLLRPIDVPGVRHSLGAPRECWVECLRAQ